MTVFRCDYAWVDGALDRNVDIHVDSTGRILGATPVAPTLHEHVIALPGVVLPGFANAHSHAFHRALRGRTHGEGGTFWTWRDRMYRLAAVLDPDSYYALARATYGEMVLAGVTCVGEFHYVHHAPDGSSYSDPNAMGEALRSAAHDAGLRLTLLDTCYLSGGLGSDGPLPLRADQARFTDGDSQRWAERVSLLSEDDTTRIGAAIHTVRAVPRDDIAYLADWVGDRPLHVHLSEQVAENDDCQRAYGISPTEVLRDAGALSRHTTAVHATHLSELDIDLIGQSGTFTCFCPTTERDLADGIGPATELALAGSPLCLGSDQHAVIDLIEEARALEMHERLVHHQRGRIEHVDLMSALTVDGHRSLGWNDAGRIAAGQRADLVAVRLDTVRTAGADPAQILLAAFASDVDTVIVDGRVVVSAGNHSSMSVADELVTAIDSLWASTT